MNDKNPNVYLEVDPDAFYPSADYFFSPSEVYPEYIFNEISQEENKVYALIRTCLRDMELDIEHYGTSEWNPFREILHYGQTVVIKPNLVMHKNENSASEEYGMECLVTHPSCIRAIVDYCILALWKDKAIDGNIVIADAPMQGCRFDELIRKIHLDTLLAYYAERGITISLVDLRQYETFFNKSKVIIGKKYKDSQGVVVDLKDKSMHCKRSSNGQYQVSDYDKAETQLFHHDDIHAYELAQIALNADLIINFCKPKTHRLAGITASMKNMVGTIYNKASLPHRTAGSTEEGGDAYLYKNWMKRVADDALTMKIRAENRKNILLATLMRYIYGVFLTAGRTFGKDTYYIGSWHGNDTIWRTIVDLNYAVLYADTKGNIHEEQQRKIMHFADMVIAGQGNGPVRPFPKKIGAICASFDGAALDIMICKLMGFDADRIPLLKAIKNGKTWIRYQDPVVHSNIAECNGYLTAIQFSDDWKFEPHEAWKKELE